MLKMENRSADQFGNFGLHYCITQARRKRNGELAHSSSRHPSSIIPLKQNFDGKHSMLMHGLVYL